MHARDRARAGQARRADQDPPQRGRAGAVRGRADLRELQRRLRPPAADDADHAERGPPLRARLPAAREAVRRRQRLGQAQQLVDGHRHGRQPARAGRHAAREPAVPVLLRGGHPGGQQAPGSCCARRSPTPGQDHRLGANEAPPAIISIFLGAELEKVFDAIESGSGDAATPQSPTSSSAPRCCRALPMHGGDRNRTSPFAFTGNKFEFRALGSSQSLALPNTVLNTIVAEAIDELADKLEARRRRLARGGRARGRQATPTPANKRIVFDGDNYSEEWHAEAEAARAREPQADAGRAAVAGRAEQTVEVFARYDVLSERELESRYEVFVEQYVTNAQHRGARRRPRSPARCCCRRRSQYLALLDDAEGGAGVAAPDGGDRRAASTSSSRRSSRSRTANARPPRDRGRARGRQVRAGAR